MYKTLLQKERKKKYSTGYELHFPIAMSSLGKKSLRTKKKKEEKEFHSIVDCTLCINKKKNVKSVCVRGGGGGGVDI